MADATGYIEPLQPPSADVPHETNVRRGHSAEATAEVVLARQGYQRDIGVTALVTAAHTTDHFLQLVVPPLFPLMKVAFGVSYAQLGLLMTAFYATSGLSQTAAGFLADRLGSLRVLAGGLGIISIAIGLVGLAPHFLLLFPLMILAGAGNSVFHPADYSLLTSV